MNIKKCFKKRTVLVSSLVMLLMVVGYLNNQLTKSALRQSSKGYKNHEETQLSKLKAGKGDTLEASSKNIEVVESNQTKQVKQTKSNANYFTEHRLSKDKLRAENLERLNKIVEDENTKEDVRSNAQAELIQLGETEEMELLIEGIIKGKGFKDTAVFVSKEGAKIIVDKEELTEQDVIKIVEIVTSETQLKPTDIKIMKKQ